MDPSADHYRRFLAGDDDAIVAIIRDNKDGLMLFLNRYVHNIHVAEELTEETFFKLVTKRPHFTDTHSFKTWLYTIGRNAALNHLKQSRRLADTPIEALASLSADEESIEQAYLRQEQHRQVHRALARLNPDYARVLYLKYFADLDNAQISRVLHKSKRQVENLLYAAKQALKIKLEQEGITHEELY